MNLCAEEESYEEADVQALVQEYMDEPEEESWQISRLVSADNIDYGFDTGEMRVGRMAVT